MGNLLNLSTVHWKATPFYQSLHFQAKSVFAKAPDKEQKQEEPLLSPLTISMCKHKKSLSENVTVTMTPHTHPNTHMEA